MKEFRQTTEVATQTLSLDDYLEQSSSMEDGIGIPYADQMEVSPESGNGGNGGNGDHERASKTKEVVISGRLMTTDLGDQKCSKFESHSESHSNS